MTAQAPAARPPWPARVGHVVKVSNQTSAVAHAHPQLYGLFAVGLRDDGAVIELPGTSGTARVSVQLAAQVGSTVAPGTSPVDALRKVTQLAVALKVVEHDWFRDVRADGTPGRIVASAADTWTVLGSPVPLAETSLAGAITLTVGDRVSTASLAHLRWSLGAVIAYAAAGTAVREGEVFLTGSPVATSDQPPLTIGDAVEAAVEGVGRVGATVGLRDLNGLQLATEPSERHQ